MSEYRLEMEGICKRFGGVQALSNASLRVKPGEIHALIGENGAGKSTMMKILSGAYQKDEGTIKLEGEEVKIDSPKTAKDLGISVIYQEFMLAPDLTVAENIFIDNLAGGSKIINWKKLKENAAEQLAKLGFSNIDPGARVGDLSVAYQQIVEICKCLSRNSKILVFDEPTAVLTFSEIDKLFEIIQQLKAHDVSVIYISHRLEELFQIGDMVTVMKDGQFVAEKKISDITKEQLVSMMVGREITQMFPDRNATLGDVVLRVNNLSAGREVNNVSFEVRAGEVVGFSGLVGAGRTETMRAIFGADKIDSGEVIYYGEDKKFRDCREAIENGFGMLPEDRKTQGLLLNQSIRMNTTLASMKKFQNNLGILNHSSERNYVKELLSGINTKYGNTEDNVDSLSGGNQQKVALAKWISADCKCIIFDEPTRGVDVGAKTEIYGIINSLAERGVAVILISSEMTEIIGMCDRAIVMRQGEISGEVLKADLTENELIKYAMGV